jgi:hypothetical protein
MSENKALNDKQLEGVAGGEAGVDYDGIQSALRLKVITMEPEEAADWYRETYCKGMTGELLEETMEYVRMVVGLDVC